MISACQLGTVLALSSRLSKSLVPASKIATLLDWKKLSGKCVIALDISRERVGLALGAHPSRNLPICSLPPIQLFTKRSFGDELRVPREEVAAELDDLVDNLDVCGFIVGWPLQPEGRPGKPCGLVLHILENILLR